MEEKIPAPAPSAPSPNKWVPKKKTPLWAALFVGTVFASAPAIAVAIPDPKIGAAVVAVLVGIAGTLATYFGIKSAGTR
jgi:fructose-specific phosphotransferase system IIC component